MSLPIVVGISGPHHDSAVCILQGQRLVAAAEEERFTRRKHQGGIPLRAFRECLTVAGLGIGDIDLVGIGFDPVALSDRRAVFGHDQEMAIDESSIRRILGVESPVVFVPHHRAHAASAFHYSPMQDAAVMVVDGVGEWLTTTISVGHGTSLDQIDEIRFPHSLGLFYAAITDWLGFRVNCDEYKVMGLAAWAEPCRQEEVAALVPGHNDGRFELNLDYFDFLHGKRMFSDLMCQLLGPERTAGAPVERHHVEVAASAQAVLEDRLLSLVGRARRLTGLTDLCVAGGVMMNAVANGKIATSRSFDHVWFQPAAGDAGTALGAASAVLADAADVRPECLTDLRLGPRYDNDEICEMLDSVDAPYQSFINDERGLVEAVAELIEGGAVVGWFAGRMEFGPRALGARSLLADPRRSATRDRINSLVKDRESWRPLAPMVGRWACAEHFASDRELPFMIEAVPVVDASTLPAVAHVDGTARPQSVSPDTMPRLAALLRAVERRIGVPVLVNTSFNHGTEPIVCAPGEALATSMRMQLDALVLDDMLVSAVPSMSASLIATWSQQPSNAASDNLYPL